MERHSDNILGIPSLKKGQNIAEYLDHAVEAGFKADVSVSRADLVQETKQCGLVEKTENGEGQSERAEIMDLLLRAQELEKDRTFAGRVVASLAGSNAKELSSAIGDYFGIKNGKTGKALREKIEELQSGSMEPLEQVRQLVLFLKQQKVKVPLKITLLLKNLNGLNRLARQAGFASLQEAFLYKP